MVDMNKRNMTNTRGLVKMTNRGAVILKTTLVAGSIIATLLGANLAAHQEQAVDQEGAVSLAPVSTPAQVVGAIAQPPPSLAAVPNLTAVPALNSVDVDKLLNQPLAPIPTFSLPTPALALPVPVTRSRSSR